MFTTDEVRAIPILSAIPTTDLERLAKSAADIQLAAGEWAVHEGDELTLTSTFPPGSAETYTGFGGAALTETITTSWFCTAGDFSVDRTSATQPHTVLRLTDRLPAAGKIIDLWAVAHDERGGVGYTHRVLELQ